MNVAGGLDGYSAVLGLLVPSAGSKWLIEVPYLLQAATQLHVNLRWVVQIYNTAEALPNLINPFWMLPLLRLLKLRRDRSSAIPPFN